MSTNTSSSADIFFGTSQPSDAPLSVRGLIRRAGRLPGVLEWRKRRHLESFLRGNGGRFHGQFATVQEARAYLPPAAVTSYDDSELVGLNLDFFLEAQLFDWPVIAHLQKEISSGQASALVDFGGHIGVKFYAVREHLHVPPSFQWQVVDVPAMVREGACRAAASGVSNLRFFERVEEAAPAEILLCLGVLQYLEGNLESVVHAMPQRPRMIILNKLPLCERGGFFTLENFGHTRLPHQIYGASAHEEMRERLGYRRTVRWEIPHSGRRIPFADPRDEVSMFGEVWVDAAS